MTESPSSTPPTARWQPLDPIQRRVLGALIEKAKTTPAGYPMSANAVVTACNQKSNRDPVMELDDFTVEKALDELRNLGAVSEVDWVGRVSKWKHHAYEWLGVSKPEIAVMTELLLRGPQSLGDLRGRAARMEPIEDLAALRPIVAALLERGLMVELTPAGRGQIVSHNLYPAGELSELKAQYGGGAHRPSPSPSPGPAPTFARAAAPAPDGAAAERLEALADELAALRAEVESLRAELADLRASLPPGRD